MQHLTLTTEIAQQVTYTNSFAKKEAIKKIIVFTAILACLVLGVNI